MWRQIQQKRNKFASQIRKKHHEQYFQIKRQNNSSHLPAIAYLPYLLQNGQYQDIRQILDFIQVSDEMEIQEKLIASVRQKYQHHSRSDVRDLMFRLINRLGLWEWSSAIKAMEFVRNGQHLYVKELCYYLITRRTSLNQQNQNKMCQNIQMQLQEGKRKKKQARQKISYKQYKKQQLQILKSIIGVKITNLEYRPYWLNIVSEAFAQNGNNEDKQIQDEVDLTKFIKNIDDFILAIDLGTQQNQNQLAQIMPILNKVVSLHAPSPASQKSAISVKHKILRMQCFPQIIKLLDKGSIQVILLGLQIIAQMMSGDDAIVYELVNKYQIMKSFQRYAGHCMVPIRMRVFWGISNIAASEYYGIIYNEPILELMFKKVLSTNEKQRENRPQVLVQIYCCIINLLCNSNSAQTECLDKRYKVGQMLASILQWIVEQKHLREILLQRTIYAIHHILNIYPKIKVAFSQKNGKKYVEELYYDSKGQEQILKMIGSLLDYLEANNEGGHEQDY